LKKKFTEIVQFIRALFNLPTEFIPLHVPCFKGNEKRYLEECIDTTFVSSVGEFVNRFEDKIATYTGVQKTVSCVNGTNALHLALKLVGVNPETEVLTQSLTFIATSNAIRYCGAMPVFLDVDMDTMGLSPNALLEFLKNETFLNNHNKLINKKTNRIISACVPVHTFGNPCRIDEIVEICSQFKIPVVEDAAESLGSSFKGKHTGAFGLIGVLSFNGNKIITTGGGGMLLFHDNELANKAKHLTMQAKIPHLWEFVHDEIGYNYRMPNINAAIGMAQFELLERFLVSKREIANQYHQFFKKLGIPHVAEPENAKSNYWLNCILLENKEERNAFLKFSNENGIMTRPAWQLMNKLEMFKKCQTDELKIASELADRLVNLPSSANI
jgi:aminotransferase in exopolysaccharide biosynthesis